MTDVPVDRSRRSGRAGFHLPQIRVPWPDGTTFFAFRTWVALAIGFYAAFFLQLQGASSAGVCVLILAQPSQGMVLSKAIYRIAGTLVGVVAALVLTAMFPQDRTMLLAAFALWMACLTVCGSILRDFRSYGCILSGYTVAIISVANIDAPAATFASAVNRVAAILVGVLALAITNSFLAGAEASKSLTSKLHDAIRDLRTMAMTALDERHPPTPSQCVEMSARLMPLRGQISYAAPEKPDGRRRAKGGRSALLGLFEMITAIQAVGTGLQTLPTPTDVTEGAVAIARKALRLQRPEVCLAELGAMTLPAIEAGTLTIAEAFVIDRIRFMIEVLVDISDGMTSVRTGRKPRRDARIEVHQDSVAVFFNAIRVLIAIAVTATLGVWSGIADTAQAVLFTAVFVSLGAVQPDPRVLGRAALFGMPAVVVAGTIYSFFVFPNITGFPLFALSLAPLVVVMCWLIMIGQGGAGLIFGVQTLVLMSPANPQTLQPETFASSATMFAVAGVSIFLSTLLILPTDPAQRRLRIALAVGDSLRASLANKDRLGRPSASRQYDRLAQFKVWLGTGTVTPARLKTMRRLVDIGNLAAAVRRAWRSLDAARHDIDPLVDLQARKLLPSLSPEETMAMAETYLDAAKDKDDASALRLVHAAAALYGTSVLTTTEMRLLNHVELLRRKI